MNAPILLSPQEVVTYPEDDGLPMSDNTLQYEYMVKIEGGLDALYRNEVNVFIAGNLLWYPVEGNNVIRQAPDVMAVFGRPKGRRGSYRQWEEGGLAPQVVFEIRSPGNRLNDWIRKFQFYQRYGVEEYYIYDPDNGLLFGYQRQGELLVEIPVMDGWISPRLGVRFQMVGSELELYGPDGRKFGTYVELAEAEEKERAEKERALRAADQDKRRAEQEKQRADKEKQRAEQEKQRADKEKQRAERLLAQLKAHGIEPEV